MNYVIASAFIGTSNDLLRIPGLLMYMIRLCLARSAAERKNVKRVSVFELKPENSESWIFCMLYCAIDFVLIFFFTH